jgi:hypothetical protein
VIIAIFGAVTTWQRWHRPGGRWVGRTHCSWFGEPRITIRPGLARVESIATVAHERIHVAECQRLGPVRYRMSTLGAQSNLYLEAPAYCAAARVRLRNGWSLATVRSTVMTDMLAAMGDQLDSATIHRSLADVCTELK